MLKHKFSMNLHFMLFMVPAKRCLLFVSHQVLWQIYRRYVFSMLSSLLLWPLTLTLMLLAQVHSRLDSESTGDRVDLALSGLQAANLKQKIFLING